MNPLPDHPDRDLDESRALDDQIANLLNRFGQTTSRRGLLAGAGRVILALVGASVVSVIPIQPIARDAEAITCGGIWCGMCGTKCCSSCGGSNTTCPPGTSVGSYWTRCCPPAGGTRYRYYDCCGGSVNCSGCTQCSDGCPQSAWCSGLGDYRCTKAIDVGPAGCPSAPTGASSTWISTARA